MSTKTWGHSVSHTITAYVKLNYIVRTIILPRTPLCLSLRETVSGIT